MRSVIGVGVNAWVWTSPFTADSVELIARAQAMGFDAFTIPVEDPAAIDGDAVGRALRDSTLRVHVTGAFGPTRDLTHDEPRFREESLRYIADTLALCELLGRAAAGRAVLLGRRQAPPCAARAAAGRVGARGDWACAAPARWRRTTAWCSRSRR